MDHSCLTACMQGIQKLPNWLTSLERVTCCRHILPGFRIPRAKTYCLELRRRCTHRDSSSVAFVQGWKLHWSKIWDGLCSILERHQKTPPQDRETSDSFKAWYLVKYEGYKQMVSITGKLANPAWNIPFVKTIRFYHQQVMRFQRFKFSPL